ncbi:hypothetical protein UFOVP1138_72 [uncultured Caudovirales phage]|uniref:Uncharacterized protein n=1 Tax=uncultured Caudovirales phage TaxID=2100421 RepID=A0A6J5PYZ8_9CAUD|nr:hypothetical protein UFOVP975_48 [uncultured Caudovirales phage]CAB4186313.1 hypothetical protein UFOVP1138_72 [uncultured Caudovirales phage]CAB4204450.1 hypothetical protein UFOVP1394_69 [uncultured Caudovirales phage]
MSQTVEQIEQEIDDALCSIYAEFEFDDIVIQEIIEYCHQHKKEIAEFIKSH